MDMEASQFGSEKTWNPMIYSQLKWNYFATMWSKEVLKITAIAWLNIYSFLAYIKYIHNCMGLIAAASKTKNCNDLHKAAVVAALNTNNTQLKL